MNVAPGAVAAAAVDADSGIYQFQHGFITGPETQWDIPPFSFMADKLVDEMVAVKYLVEKSILPWCDKPGVVCGLCEGPVSMKTKYNPQRHQGNVPNTCFVMRCRKANCVKGHPRWQQSIFKGTIFENCNKPINEVLHFFWLWAGGAIHKDVKQKLGWTDNTVTDWLGYMREVCDEFVCADEGMYRMGTTTRGEVIDHCQIDESKFGKTKLVRGHAGRNVPGVWVFGIIEAIRLPDGGHKMGKVFAVAVDERTKLNLIPIIKEHVAPGSHIVSDGFSSYQCISDPEDIAGEMEYTHGTVIHDREFKNEDDETTNMMEGAWRWMKVRIPKQAYNAVSIQKHLFEYMWRNNNRGRIFCAMLECLAQIKYDAEEKCWTFE